MKSILKFSNAIRINVLNFLSRVGKLEALPKGDAQYRLLHGLYGSELFSIMDDMKSFLDEHVNEIIILDFQHMFSCSDSDHRTIIKRIESTFGSKLLEQSKEIPSLKEMQVSTMYI